jgi:hypothetical protein
MLLALCFVQVKKETGIKTTTAIALICGIVASSKSEALSHFKLLRSIVPAASAAICGDSSARGIPYKI